MNPLLIAAAISNALELANSVWKSMTPEQQQKVLGWVIEDHQNVRDAFAAFAKALGIKP